MRTYLFYSQYHGCWCPGDARSQGISNHGIGLVKQRQLCPRTLRVNTLRLRQNGHNFPGDVFKCIFLNENVWISLRISLKFVPKVPINNIPTLVQITAWRRSGNKPFSEPIMVNLLTHICVTQPQWANNFNIFRKNINLFLHLISCHRSLKSLLMEEKRLPTLVNIIAADVLVTQGDRISAATILT